MDDSRDRDAWNHTSFILATIQNSNPFREGPAVKHTDVHPHYVRPGAGVPVKEDLSILKTLVVERRNQNRKKRRGRRGNHAQT
jgi:hypothetical protein